MSCQDATIHACLTPIGKYQLKEFTSIIFLDGKDLICASKDGRIFQYDTKNYEIKRTFFLHSSWISAVFLNEKYFITGSYDMNVMVTTSNEIYDYSKPPNFSKFSEHNDYILAVAACGDILISSSSEPLILLSKIEDNKIQTFKSICLSNSVHTIFCNSDNEMLFGTTDGKLLLTYINSPNDQNQIYIYDSPTKILSKNSSLLACGYLDGTVLLFKIKNESNKNKNEYKYIEKKKFSSRIVSISPYKEKFIIFTDNGNIYDLNNEKPESIEIGKPISYGCVTIIDDLQQTKTSDKSDKVKKKIPLFHISTSDGFLFCINSDNEILRKIKGSLSYTKAVRIPQTFSSVLCKTSRKEVVLLNLKTFEIEKNFGSVSFKQKLKELSKSPSVPFPISFDVSNGYVKIIIPPILPKLMQSQMKAQKEELTAIIKKMIEKKVMIFALDNKGKTIWWNYSDESVPYWFKYLIEPKFS